VLRPGTSGIVSTGWFRFVAGGRTPYPVLQNGGIQKLVALQAVHQQNAAVAAALAARDPLSGSLVALSHVFPGDWDRSLPPPGRVAGVFLFWAKVVKPHHFYYDISILSDSFGRLVIKAVRRAAASGRRCGNFNTV